MHKKILGIFLAAVLLLPCAAWEPEERLSDTPAPFCMTYLVKPEQSTPVCGSFPP